MKERIELQLEKIEGFVNSKMASITANKEAIKHVVEKDYTAGLYANEIERRAREIQEDIRDLKQLYDELTVLERIVYDCEEFAEKISQLKYDINDFV